MKRLGLYSYLAFLVLLLVGPARAQRDNPVAADLFKMQVHPYLIKNCSHCHSEKAINPQGPTHSDSSPELAFPVFSRFVNWTNPITSRIVRMAGNKHFCTEYGYNCERSEQIASEVPELIVKYVRDVLAKTPQKVSSVLPPTSPKGIRTTAKPAKPIAEPPFVTGEGLLISSPGLQDFYLEFDLSSKVPNLKAMLVFHKYYEEYAHLDAVYLISNRGILSMKGLSFIVNGQPLELQTGYEQLDRTVYFGELQSPRNVRLALYQPLVPIKPTDKVRLQFAELTPLESYPAVLCSDTEVAAQMIVDIMNDGVLKTNPRELFAAGSDAAIRRRAIVGTEEFKSLCYEIETRINLKIPRRSVLLAETYDPHQTLERIKVWLAKYSFNESMKTQQKK